MGQADVIKVLEKAKKWLTSKEIAKITKVSSSNASLKKLSERGEIMKREIDHPDGRSARMYEYRIKE